MTQLCDHCKCNVDTMFMNGMDYEDFTTAQCADTFTRSHSSSGYFSIRDGKCVYSDACPESEIARDLALPWELYNYDGDCSNFSKQNRKFLTQFIFVSFEKSTPILLRKSQHFTQAKYPHSIQPSSPPIFQPYIRHIFQRNSPAMPQHHILHKIHRTFPPFSQQRIRAKLRLMTLAPRPLPPRPLVLPMNPALIPRHLTPV